MSRTYGLRCQDCTAKFGVREGSIVVPPKCGLLQHSAASRMSLRDTPFILTAETDAALLECGLNTSVLILALPKSSFIQRAIDAGLVWFLQ